MGNLDLCSTAQKVLAALMEQPGTHAAVEDVSARIDCTPPHTECALEWLATAGLIERWECAKGTVTYVVRR